MTKPKTRIKRADIVAALKACGGGVYLAARQLNCAPGTLYKRMAKDERLRAIVEDIRGEMVDIAEAGLRKAMIGGDVTAMIWVTKTLGKDRGYVVREEHEISGRDGGPVQIQPFRYDDAVARIAARPERDSLAPGANQDHQLRPALGEDDDGG